MPAATSKRSSLTLAVACLGALALAACATTSPPPRSTAQQAKTKAKRVASPQSGGRDMVGSPYQVGGVWYVPSEQPNYDKTGVASWYGEPFHNRRTANGETFDMFTPSAAHTTLPLPSIVEVTNLDNGRRIQVRVNDRGPFYGGRIIDLSRAAADELGFFNKGTARVRVRYVGPAPLIPSTARPQLAMNERRPPAAAPPPPPQPAPQPTQIVSGPPPAPVPAPSPAAPAGAFAIQAGSFSSRDNAERAVAQLSVAGQAVIRPIVRGGSTLYRVVVMGGWADEAKAAAALPGVAAAGFADARVVPGF